MAFKVHFRYKRIRKKRLK